MKKISLIIFTLCFFHLSLSGQNVGIGTSNPAAKLHLNENNGSSVIQKLTTPDAEVILGFNPTNEGILGTVSKHDLRIRTHDINRFNIGSSGKIGIGTITPSEKLQLFDGSFFMSSLGSTNEKGILFGESTDPIYGWIYDGVGSGSNNRLHLREFLGTPSDILSIDGDGNVGFGEKSPSQKIHVKDGSILLSNLGETESKGYLLGESGFPTYGWIYDGIGSGADNTLILREFIGPESDLMVIDADGKTKIKDLAGTKRRALYAQEDGTIVTDPGILHFSKENGKPIEEFFESIHLPEGAKIISILFRYIDNSDESQFFFTYTRQEIFTAAIESSLVTTGSAFNSPNVQTAFLTIPSSKADVNNQDFTYTITAFRQEPFDGVGADLSFLRYRIKYTLE